MNYHKCNLFYIKEYSIYFNNFEKKDIIKKIKINYFFYYKKINSIITLNTILYLFLIFKIFPKKKINKKKKEIMYQKYKKKKDLSLPIKLLKSCEINTTQILIILQKLNFNIKYLFNFYKKKEIKIYIKDIFFVKNLESLYFYFQILEDSNFFFYI